ncbi:MAG TPA: DUF58 domain-containing protein [Candidatus Dormibacteraeota bacterium]
MAAAVFYYGTTSEVAWLFLLAYWIAALVVAAYVYARWNWRGLRADLGLGGARPGPDSPIDALPEQLLRSGPLPAPVFEGDQADIELRMTTTGGARGPARLSGSIGGADVRAATGLVPRAGWVERRTLGPLPRGAIVASNWILESSDPLGFFRFRRKGANGEIGVVLPRFTSLSSVPQARELEASVSAPRSGSGTELFGVREYRPGDPLRRIHWRSSARLGELVVREYEPPGVQTVGIFCDPNPPSQEIADQVARLAASEAWDCIRSGGRVVLWAPGLEPSLPREARSLWALLEWLAKYPGPAAGDEMAPSVTDAVGVTAGGSVALTEALETVQQHGGRIRAWVVGDIELNIEAPIQRVGTGWPL